MWGHSLKLGNCQCSSSPFICMWWLLKKRFASCYPLYDLCWPKDPNQDPFYRSPWWIILKFDVLCKNLRECTVLGTNWKYLYIPILRRQPPSVLRHKHLLNVCSTLFVSLLTALLSPRKLSLQPFVNFSQSLFFWLFFLFPAVNKLSAH